MSSAFLRLILSISLAALGSLGCSGGTGLPLDAGLDAPAPDASLAEGCVRQVAAGGTHTCAIRADGSLWCWGYDLDGRLGLGMTDTEARPPTRVDGAGTDVSDLVLGAGHTCIVDGSMGVLCWGLNDVGQVGNGTVGGTVTEPISIPIPEPVRGVVAGRFHTCALTEAGSVWCWGDNVAGAIGDGTLGGRRPSPVRVEALGRRVVTLAAGTGHNCAVDADGSVWCWGFNLHGQLGDGSVGASASPVRVSGIRGEVVQLAAGWSLSCALDSAGSVQCWGGLIGDETRENQRPPTAIAALSADVVALSSGFTHTCALKSDGSAWCWGSNQNEEVRAVAEDFLLSPVQSWANGTPPISEIAVGEGYTCSRRTSGAVWCWGSSAFGAVDGTLRRFPNQIAAPIEVGLPCPSL